MGAVPDPNETQDETTDNTETHVRVSSKYHNFGFTLIELLIALGMMAVILGTIYSTYTLSNRAVSRSGTKTAIAQEACTLLLRLGREIRCSHPAPGFAERPGSFQDQVHFSAPGHQAISDMIAPLVIDALRNHGHR